MGDVAEMMLDGTLCAGCGEFLDQEPQGFPGYCSAQCARDHGSDLAIPRSRRSKGNATKAARINAERERIAGEGLPLKSFSCPSCSKRFRYAVALAQHERDKHGALKTAERREQT